MPPAPNHGRGPVLAVAILLSMTASAAAAPPPPPTGPLPTWPCHTPQTGDLSAADLLPRATPAATTAEAWRANPDVRAAAEFAAAPENPPDTGFARLDALAASAGPNRQAELLLALDGIVVQTNKLRGFITEGIGDAVVKSRLIAERLGEFEKSLAALPPGESEQRKGLESARFWTRRALGDAGDSADLLCHRLDYTAVKAKRLADHIARLLGQS